MQDEAIKGRGGARGAAAGARASGAIETSTCSGFGTD